MSVTNTPRKAGPYTGNNTDVQYTFGFKVFADSDLVVTRAVIATGAESTLVLTTDYSVTLNADQDNDPGGYITLTTALASTYTLTLTSAVPDTQPAVFTNLGGFFPAVLNNALDRLTILVQQISEKVNRSLKLAVSTPTGFDAQLPAPVPFGIVCFNGDGTGFATTDATGTTAIATALAAPDGATLVGGDLRQTFATGSIGAACQEVADHLFGRDGTVGRAIGDSITKGGAVANPFPALLAAAMGWTMVNSGIDGAQTHDAAVPLYATTVGARDNITVAAGINNMRVSAGSATKLRYFRQSHAALVAFAAIPDSKKIRATDARITYAGTWANNNTYSGTTSKYSITQGSTATFEVSGSVVYIGTTMTETSVGQFKVTVDGVDKGVYSGAAAGITTPLGQAFGPRLVRIPLPQGGRHTVVITVTSATAANNNVFVDWVAGNETASGPKVYVGNITYMDATGYGIYGGSTSLTDTYNRTIRENCIDLANDGLSVFYVDSNAVINPATDLADHLHPTQAGYQDIADAFQAAAVARVTAATRVCLRPLTLNSFELGGYIGAPGELTFNEDNSTQQTHDGATAGSPSTVLGATLTNSWSNAYATANGLSPVRFHRDSNGVVHVEGHASAGVVGAGTPIFTLPAGCRPYETKIFTVISNDALGKLAIFSDGKVSVIIGNNTYVSLEGVSFRAA